MTQTPPQPQQEEADTRKKNWIGRHKVLTGVGPAVVGLIVIGGAISSCSSASLSAESKATLQTIWDGQDFAQHLGACSGHTQGSNPHVPAENLAAEAQVSEGDSALFLDLMCSDEAVASWGPSEQENWISELG